MTQPTPPGMTRATPGAPGRLPLRSPRGQREAARELPAASVGGEINVPAEARALMDQHPPDTDRPLFDQAEDWMKRLQDAICASLEAFEPQARFQRRSWTRSRDAGPNESKETALTPEQDPGGGVSARLAGDVFEKGGVNVSSVKGVISERFRREVRGADQSDGRFRATGLSLVIHPRSPFVPAIHMNTRIIETSVTWFGGGMDLNPVFPNDAETAFFKGSLRAVCDASPAAHGQYDGFAKTCDDYFFIPHRNESRGVGGIFFDHFCADKPNDLPGAFDFIKRLGSAFIPVYRTLAEANVARPWDEADRAFQLVRRGRYAEFNLVYDRGTRFGLMTGADSEAVLMSLPPVATWP